MIHRFVDLELAVGFVPYEKESTELWKVPFAGGTPVMILDRVTDDVQSPVASPDFSQVAYLSNDGDEKLRVCNADGTGDAEIDSGRCRYPHWKPDGTNILFTTFNLSELGAIVRIDPDGSNRTVIHDISPNTASRAIYNRDGTLIAYFDDDDEEVWVVEADGSNPTKVGDLIQGGVSENSIAWQHTADVVAFGDGGIFNNGDGWYYQVDADGSNLVQLAQADTTASDRAMLSKFAWSEDDGVLLFPKFDGPGGHYSIWSVPEGGGADTQLSPTFGVFRLPAFTLGGRLWADGEDAVDPLGLISALADGTDQRVDDPDTVRLEFPN